MGFERQIAKTIMAGADGKSPTADGRNRRVEMVPSLGVMAILRRGSLSCDSSLLTRVWMAIKQSP
ncbi:hypothetical protein PGT21_002286 [Puccinia graminis f. sp. tritici]|uniref:Uncharacterized protein n=1 Tax=Puccinia graminis f. sp. tritici TaxID=56615 RepID=A0A5B0N507_PUCGR|nr:hypothetical protein PGT21_002286 [Puccinia graminis f. sp. tritici]KAA1123384.1 hypothetical protein PGTUg99_018261 [Puccinia graminis f. sp. tritici]